MPQFPLRFAMFLLISSPDAAVVRSGAMAFPPAGAEREREKESRGSQSTAPMALCENEGGKKERERAVRKRRGEMSLSSVCLCMSDPKKCLVPSQGQTSSRFDLVQ